MKFTFNHSAKTFGEATGMTHEDDVILDSKIKQTVAEELESELGLSQVLENMINRCSPEELAIMALEHVKYLAKTQAVMQMLRVKSVAKPQKDVERDNKKSHE